MGPVNGRGVFVPCKKSRVQSLYNTPHYTDLDTKWSCCGSQSFLPWNFTLGIIGRNGNFPIIPL